ncbi:MAG: ATP-binding protein, partial [Erysipelotrichaceae bacterium]
HLAEQLGAKVVTSYGNDVVEQIAEYAKVARVSKIVLGRTNTRRNFFFVRESFSSRLTNMAPNLEIFLIPNSYNDEPFTRNRKLRMHTVGLSWDVFATLSVLAFATVVSTKIRHFSFSETSIPMLYLLGVLFVSLATQRKAMSILYSLGSIVIYNYYFVAPFNTLFVYNSEQFVTFFIMFVTALISSSLTQKVKDAARSNAKKSYRTEILLETSLKLQNSNTADEIAAHITAQLGKLLEKNVCFFLGNPVLNPTPIASYLRKGSEGEMQLNPQEIGVAEWTFKNNKHAGFSTTTLPGARCLYLAIRNGVKVFAVVGIDMERKEIPAFEKDVMGAILNECALALEKNELIQEQQHTHLKLEQEQLRANLLRSISHDLRTPLTSISGNASILLDQDSKIEEQQKQKLYLDIYDDSMWLINLVENLLSVTRIENGTMNLNMQPELLSDVISEAIKHINRRNVDHVLSIVEEDDLLVANMDAKLIMQVIINLVDNAIKYTDVGSHITISTWKQRDEIIVEVRDDGWGIPDEQKAKLFEMFYTVENQVADGRRGMGLGLALCKSIVEAHGGQLSVHDNVPTGTIFRFCLKAQEVYIHEE